MIKIVVFVLLFCFLIKKWYGFLSFDLFFCSNLQIESSNKQTHQNRQREIEKKRNICENQNEKLYTFNNFGIFAQEIKTKSRQYFVSAKYLFAVADLVSFRFFHTFPIETTKNANLNRIEKLLHRYNKHITELNYMKWNQIKMKNQNALCMHESLTLQTEKMPFAWPWPKFLDFIFSRSPFDWFVVFFCVCAELLRWKRLFLHGGKKFRMFSHRASI